MAITNLEDYATLSNIQWVRTMAGQIRIIVDDFRFCRKTRAETIQSLQGLLQQEYMDNLGVEEGNDKTSFVNYINLLVNTLTANSHLPERDLNAPDLQQL